MSREQLDSFFSNYENAVDKLDLKTITGYCADSFIFAGPKGVITQGRNEYKEKAEHSFEFYKSIGHKSARIISKRIMPISNDYTMVVVRWGVTFEKTGAREIELDVSYILGEIDVSPKIILLIAHQDEEASIKKLGLQSIKH